MAEPARAEVARAARHLVRACRAATLATSDAGRPFASLITPATAVDGSVLMLLSGLSPHTRHLRAEASCSILAMAAPTGRNPQTAPRVTLTGTAAPEPDPGLKARWVAVHPYAAFYAGLGDFQLWRLRPLAGQYVGGFASAHRLDAAELCAVPDAAAALQAAEAAILAHCNQDHADAMAAIAHAHGGSAGAWRLVACDPDGIDLAQEEEVLRVAFVPPVASAGEVRAALVRLAHAARIHIAPQAGPAV